MLIRRAVLALPLVISACASDPVADYLGGFGSPIRGAILYAPRNLGDTSIYADNPAGAAMATAQMEFLARELRQDPIYGPQVSPTLQPSLDAGVAEMREAIGIARGAESIAVERSMRRVAQQLRAGDQLGALRTLGDLILYPAGPEATLRRLGALPYLRRVSIAAGGAATELDRLDRSRR